MEKNDLQKLGVQSIRPYLKNGRWIFKQNNSVFDLAPAHLTEVSLNPLVLGVDKLINLGCNVKKIPNPEDGFNLLFSGEYFPNADIILVKKQQKVDGWIYGLEPANIKEIMTGQSVWICSYMFNFFKEPPEKIFVKLEG